MAEGKAAEVFVPANLTRPSDLILCRAGGRRYRRLLEVEVVLPKKGVETDYGGIEITLIGYSDCRRILRPNETLSDQILEMATQYVRNQIGNH